MTHPPVYTAHPPAPALHGHLPSPSYPVTFGKQPQVLRQRTGFFCPVQPFQFIPTPTQCPAVLALWGPFIPTSVCTHWSLCPRAREQCAKTQKEDGRRDLPFPPTPPVGPHALCLPTALSGCTWLFMSPATSPQAVNAGRRLSPVCSVPRPLPLLCLLPGCFPRESQGSFVSLSKRAAPLAFPLEHTAWPNSAFSIIVQCVPLCTVQSIVFCLDFSVSSALRTVPGSSTNLC